MNISLKKLLHLNYQVPKDYQPKRKMLINIINI